MLTNIVHSQPLIPIPPFCLSRCVHILVNLGKRYWYWASSTWVLVL